MNTTIIIHNKATLKTIGHHTQRAFQPMVCVETGERFASMTDAAEAKGVSVSNISVAARDPKNRKCCNHHWIRASQITEHADMLLDRTSALHEENESMKQKLAEQEAEMAEFRAWKAEQERARKAEENRQQAIAKAKEKLERRKRMALRKQEECDNAWNRVREADLELAELLNEKEN